MSETGEVSEATMVRLASELGVEPTALHEAVETTIRPAFEAQADKVMSEVLGGSSELVEACKDWLADERPKEVAAAVKRQLTLRQAGDYGDLAREFLMQLDESHPEAILDAELADGVEVKQDGFGQIVVIDPQGRSYTWRSAVSAGIVKVA